eukprot:gene18552-25059_t
MAPKVEVLSAADVEATLARVKKAVNDAKDSALPGGGEFHYYKNFPSFGPPIKEQVDKIRGMLMSCTAALHPSAPKIGPDWDDHEEVLSWVTDLLDDSLEKVGSALDAHHKAVKSGDKNEDDSITAALPSQATIAVQHQAGKHGIRLNPMFQRPQDSFPDAVENSNIPFRHKARCQEAAISASQGLGIGSGIPPSHPYFSELASLDYEPWQLEATEPQAPRPLEETPLLFVDTTEALQQLVEEISEEPFIAVDLENHSYRSFQGFTCLMQISSRTSDYIVDVIALRAFIGDMLGPMFLNPKVVKVLHGSDHDVEWLQRDFGIYIVNMFDTGQAARVLRHRSAGLAFLLDHYCTVKADKKYQLADWRVRPLAPELLHYARSDTHYLLYIHDCLKVELQEACDDLPPDFCCTSHNQLQVPHDFYCALPPSKAEASVALQAVVPPDFCCALPPTKAEASVALQTVVERSRLLCCKLYEKELLHEDTAERAAIKWCLMLNPQQMRVFCKLYAWRDAVCREEDESPGYVMSKANLVNLSQQMPATVKELQRVLGRNASEPILRRTDAALATIAEGKKEPTFKPVLQAAPPSEAEAKAGGAEGGTGGGSSSATPAEIPAQSKTETSAQDGLQPKLVPQIKAKAVGAISMKRKGGMFGGAARVVKPKAQTQEASTSQPTPTSEAHAGETVEKRKMTFEMPFVGVTREVALAEELKKEAQGTADQSGDTGGSVAVILVAPAPGHVPAFTDFIAIPNAPKGEFNAEQRSGGKGGGKGNVTLRDDAKGQSIKTELKKKYIS